MLSLMEVMMKNYKFITLSSVFVKIFVQIWEFVFMSIRHVSVDINLGLHEGSNQGSK